MPNDVDFEGDNVITTKYVSNDDLNLQCSLKTTLLSLIHFNARSLCSKFSDFELLVNDFNKKFDIIAVSETWFDEETPLFLYNLDGYSLHHASRKDKKGGGVALYASNHLICKQVKISSYENMYESIFIELTIDKNVHVLVSCIYRRPGCCIRAFCNELRPLLHDVIKSNQSVFICGDFNINLLKYDDHSATREFIDLMSNFSLKPTVTKPTRITRDTQTLIDNIFTNELIKPIQSGILISDISDHLPVFVLVEQTESHASNTSRKSRMLMKRRLNEEAMANFKNSLQNTDWSAITDNDVNDVDHAYNLFLHKFLSIYNSTCPMESIAIRQKKASKPWMTSGLKRACRKKNQLYKKYLCYRNDASEQTYKRYKNNLISILRGTEKNYYHSLLQTQVGDMKNMWRSVNSIIGKGKTCENFPNDFIEGDRIISSPQEISNGLNRFFTEIGSKLAHKIRVVDKSPLSYIQSTNHKTMLLRPASEEEIENIVKSCKKKNSRDYHDLSMTVVQNVITTIKAPLTHICNLSLATGVFPEKMKIAKVIPLFKAGEKNIFNNYRPVSLLPQLSKILEKIFHNRLDSFLEDSKVLSDSQYGFRSKCNTTHAILKLIESISDSLDKRKSTIGIFIDLKKSI